MNRFARDLFLYGLSLAMVKRDRHGVTAVEHVPVEFIRPIAPLVWSAMRAVVLGERLDLLRGSVLAGPATPSRADVIRRN